MIPFVLRRVDSRCTFPALRSTASGHQSSGSSPGDSKYCADCTFRVSKRNDPPASVCLSRHDVSRNPPMVF